MAGSVDEGGPPESWEVADVDAAMSRLMMTSSSSSKLESNNNNNKNSSSSSSAPDLSSCEEEVVNSSVDQFLREALQNPRERLSVLRIEQDVEKFVRDPSQQQMEFQQLPTSYLRLAAHRVAQHYSLQSTVLLDNNLPDGSGSRIIVFKTSECHLPQIRLADIPIKLPSDDSGNSVVKVAIKQRPNKRSQLGGGNLNSQRSNSLKSVEERKEEYNRARARIFSPNSSSSVKQESDQRIQEVVQRSSVGASKAEEVLSSTRVDVNSGRGSVDSSTGGSRPGRSRIEEPIGRSNSNNGRVAIFRDREVERNDPDYDRSYDRYAQRFDPGFGFNGGSYPVQPMYAPVITYNTEFPQLGSAHRAQSISSEHQPHTLAQHLPGQWVAPSSPAGIGYRPQETMVTPLYSPNQTLYMQYPSQQSGLTFYNPREHEHQQLTQSQQQQPDASFGLGQPR